MCAGVHRCFDLSGLSHLSEYRWPVLRAHPILLNHLNHSANVPTRHSGLSICGICCACMTCNLLIRVTSEDLRSVHSIKITCSRSESTTRSAERNINKQTSRRVVEQMNVKRSIKPLTSKQTNKQTNKQASKQASKQTNKQTNKQTTCGPCSVCKQLCARSIVPYISKCMCIVA